MADAEAEQESGVLEGFGLRLHELAAALGNREGAPGEATSRYCQDFCQTLVEYADRWSIEKEPLSLVRLYSVALASYARASSCLSPQCESVTLMLERLALSCVELLLLLPEQLPDGLWEEVQTSIQMSHNLLLENGITQLQTLCTVVEESSAWSNSTLQAVLSKEDNDPEKVRKFLAAEGPVLLEMRIKHLIKENQVEQAAVLAKVCSEFPEFEGKGHFKQTQLVCLCAVEKQDPLMEELAKVDCRDALEMICNLESEGDEKGAFSLCSAFLTRQLLQGDSYCAWELTLFWSKLLKRLESSAQVFLDKCRQMSLLSKTVFHILFLIKVVQSELGEVGLPVCIEMCVRALQMAPEESGNTKATVCKTILCLLPSDLEVKRACQLTEFLLEPTVDSYYAVETLYNEPDQKLEGENLPIPNSLRCELLLVFKTQWPFDPEFWDWKTLKRHCLALMGEEASIVSSIDELNDTEVLEDNSDRGLGGPAESFWEANELIETTDEKKKKKDIKKLKEKGFISARFRNWQAYMQYCVLCDKEFLGHRIVRHAQIHYKDGIYSCPICADSFDSKEVLMPHVASHVKQSCKERLAAIKTSRKLANNSKMVLSNLPVLKDRPVERLDQKTNVDNNVDSIIKKENVSSVKPECSEEFICPVSSCRKGFKYYRNLMAHVKGHNDNDEANRYLEMQSKKVICQYCRRHFISVAHLNDHLQVHCGVEPYICIQLNCNASFLSSAELLVHRKGHVDFRAKCIFPNCGRIFHDAYLLYDHEAHHYKMFTCKEPNCRKVFNSQSQLDLHQDDHMEKVQTPLNYQTAIIKKELDHSLYEQDPNHSMLKQDPNHSSYLNQEVHTNQAVPHHSSVYKDNEVELCLAEPVKVKHSVESMLNTALGVLQCTEHRELFAKEILPQDEPQIPVPCPDSSVIHSSIAVCASDVIQPPVLNTSLQHEPKQAILPVSTQNTSQKNCSSHFVHPLPTLQQNTIKVDGSPYCRSPTPVPYSVPILGQNQALSGQNSHCMSSVIPGPHQSSASNTVPPQTTPLPAYGVGPSVGHSNTPTQAETSKERHRCAFETCTRNYSSYRSVTKHMKQVHPDFYVEWKLAKKNNRLTKTPTRTMLATMGKVRLVAPSQNGSTMPSSSHVHASIPLPGSGPIPVAQKALLKVSNQPTTYSATSCPAPSKYPTPANPNTSFSSQLVDGKSQTLPNHVMNALNPDMLSHARTVQSNSQWSSQPGNNTDASQQAVCSSHLLNPHIHTIPAQSYHSHISSPNVSQQHTKMDQAAFHTSHSEIQNQFSHSHMQNSSMQSGEALHVPSTRDFTTSINPGHAPQVTINSRHSHTSSQILPGTEGLTNSMVATPSDHHPHSVMPSYLETLKDPSLSDNLDSSQSPLYSSQTQSTPFNNFKPPDKIIRSCTQNTNPDFEPEGNLIIHTGGDSGSVENGATLNSNNGATVKPARRNKRAKWPAIVKDGKFICCRCFREFPSSKSLGGHLSKRIHCKAFGETESDLSSDLPSSFLDLLNSPHVLNAPQHTVLDFHSDMTFKEEPGQSLDSRFFPNVTFPQANGSGHTSNGEQDGEVLKQVVDNPAIPGLFENSVVQQTQTSSVSKSIDNCLPEGTVIQHTGNIHVKIENVRDSGTKAPDFKQDQSCIRSDFSDPLLSQENSPAVPLSLPTDHLNQILRAEMLMKMKQMKETAGKPEQGSLSNENLLAVMASLSQNLKSNPLLQIASPAPQQSLVTATSSNDDQQKILETDVRTKLREQILAGDIVRRSGMPQSGSEINVVLAHSNLQTPPIVDHQAFGSHSDSKLSELGNFASSSSWESEVNGCKTATDFSPHTDRAFFLSNQTDPREATAELSKHSIVRKSVTNDIDRSSTDLLTVEDKIFEIQRALEKLSLDKVIVDNEASKFGSCLNDKNVTSLVSKVVENNSVPVIPVTDDDFVKPFACSDEGCDYRAMTKDALFKHLIKMHNYTEEMINEVRKNHDKFAPFRCLKCSKKFTRNSNLRAHCKSVHHMSQEEMSNLKQTAKPKHDIISNTDPLFVNVKNSVNVNHTKSNEVIQWQPALNTIHQRKDVGLAQQPDTNKMYTSTCQKTYSDMVTAESSQTDTVLATPIAQGVTLSNPHSIIGQPMAGATIIPRPLTNIQTDVLLNPDMPGLLQGLPNGATAGQVTSESHLAVAIKPKVDRSKTERERKEKKHNIKNGVVDPFSPYKPYRCVHQGCTAAFTIQHNLILHYKAVHQSVLAKFDVNNDEQNVQQSTIKAESHQEKDVVQVSEFRCQVKDCSRIFQEVTGLLQHYLQLHKFALTRAGSLLSSMNLGRFRCDQPNCNGFFTAIWKYITHIEEDHKGANLSKTEPVEGLFKCEVDGCDRGYATKSNLLRHTMKKHQELYKLNLVNQQKERDRSHLGEKENIQNNKKNILKGNEKKKNNHWTKYGKPSLKPKEEASAMCTKKFPLQYPCMIKGCESVMNSERNIMNHYIGHGLSERYLEQQRSHFIFCKKIPRSKCRYWTKNRPGKSKCEDGGTTTTETSENEDVTETEPEVSETESFKPASGKGEITEAEMSDAKHSTTDGSETKSVVLVKRKRGRPRKSEVNNSVLLSRRKATQRIINTRSKPFNHIANTSVPTPSDAVAGNNEQNVIDPTLSSFKPMGFEVSFLQFLKQSSSSGQPPKRKASDYIRSDIPVKLKMATVLCKRTDVYLPSRENQKSVNFKNPQNLTSMKNVRIVVDKTFSHVKDGLLKQLQEMRPLVILQKC